MGVKDYSLNADDNTQINGINIAEGCPPSGINNAIRQLMADVKADSDDQNNTASTPATSTSLGPVIPQTGDEDGLELEKDGKLRVRKASDTQRGSVLSSTTAAANAVPKAAADGTLHESWLKKAMDAAANTLPVGSLIASFASSMPGCLLCDGAAVSRITYKDLFAIIATKFGNGDGSTTFNLPDFRNKTLWGADGNLMKVIAPGLPNITGNINTNQNMLDPYGAFYWGSSGTVYSHAGSGYQGDVNIMFDASRSDGIYGNSTTVQPPAISVNIFIKY